MKKFAPLFTISILLFAMLLGSCTSKNKYEEETFRIALVTGSGVQNPEIFTAAERVLKKYGSQRVIHTVYPDFFVRDKDKTKAKVMKLADDPELKAIVICQAIDGMSAAIEAVKSVRPDILVIAAEPTELSEVITAHADIVLAPDDLKGGERIPKQAYRQGAKTLVHYSFERHMNNDILKKRFKIMEEQCLDLGIELVYVEAPDPASGDGADYSRRFIVEDVPKKIKEYGEDTAFFATNCAMQASLIKSVVEGHAIYPQPCCPSPFHGFKEAMGVIVPADKQFDAEFMVSELQTIMQEKNMTGRISTWPVAVNAMFVEAGAKYAIDYATSKIGIEPDEDLLLKYFKKYAKTDLEMQKLEIGGRVFDNYFLVSMDYVDL